MQTRRRKKTQKPLPKTMQVTRAMMKDPAVYRKLLQFARKLKKTVFEVIEIVDDVKMTERQMRGAVANMDIFGLINMYTGQVEFVTEDVAKYFAEVYPLEHVVARRIHMRVSQTPV